MLKEKILQRKSGLLFYGLTPPKLHTESERLSAIAQKQMERLSGIDIDGLILYDIQDETARIDTPRPFPYMPTLAPETYSEEYLGALDVPKIIYKSVGKYTPEAFRQWLIRHEEEIDCTVFVGSPSRSHQPALPLSEAYRLRQQMGSSMVLGGVAIPERHVTKQDEHQRMFDKIDNGCSFFVTQCVYNLDNAKNVLSDYYYACRDKQQLPVPVVFTLTPCGSLKTLDFMKWLGIEIPVWLNNELKHSEDILAKSIDACRKIAIELMEYSAPKGIPIGFNIESVAVRKEEIEASIELLKDLRHMM